MNEIEVTKQHMEALKALADINVKIGVARGVLTKLEETETEYLVSREKKAVDRIQKVLDDSGALVEQINKNYEAVESFAQAVGEGSKILEDACVKFKELTDAFDKRSELWERDIANREETMLSLARALKVDGIKIQHQRENLDRMTVDINNKTRKMQDERGTLDRAIKRLKEGKV